VIKAKNASLCEKGNSGWNLNGERKRYEKANNLLVPAYEPRKLNSYIMYVNVNNLYGWAMSQPLLTGILDGNMLFPWRK